MPIPAAVYSSLWASYGPSQKIAAYNTARTTIDELLGAGVPQSDIDWMLSNGYEPPEPARTIQQEPIYRQPEPEPEPEPIYYEPEPQPEPIYTQPEPEPQPVYTPQPTPTPVLPTVNEPIKLSAQQQLQQAIQNARYEIAGEQGNETAYNDIVVNGKTYAVINPETIVRKADDQSGLFGKQTRYEYLDPATGETIIDVQVDGGALQAVMPIILAVGTAAFPGVAQAIGSALGATGATAAAVGNAVINASVSVASGVDPLTAIKNATVNLGVGELANGLTDNSLVNNVIKSGATAAEGITGVFNNMQNFVAALLFGSLNAIDLSFM